LSSGSSFSLYIYVLLIIMKILKMLFF